MAQEEASSPKMISLKTVDGVVFEVEPEIAKEMKTVQSFIEDPDTAAVSTAIPLHNVNSKQLKMIIQYLKQHRLGEAKEFDAEFVKPLSHEELQLLILAVNYLNVNGLLEFLCETIADLINGKSIEFVRKFFNVENDFTKEEEAKIREEYKWAFDDDVKKDEDLLID